MGADGVLDPPAGEGDDLPAGEGDDLPVVLAWLAVGEADLLDAGESCCSLFCRADTLQKPKIRN